MSKIKILIVEDDMIIAEDLAGMLGEAGYEVTGCFDNGEDALLSAKVHTPDLAFLDISILGAFDGIEVAKRLKLIGDIPFIFLTNILDNKTIRKAKALDPANYLLKPFTANQLYVSINMALQNLAEQKEAQVHTGHQESDAGLEVMKDVFFIRQGSGAFYKYNISDILYIQAERSYCRIFLASGEELLQSANMKDTQAKIRHPHFVKVSRSYIINIEKVDAIKANVVVIKGHEITVSREYIDKVLKRLNIVR